MCVCVCVCVCVFVCVCVWGGGNCVCGGGVSGYVWGGAWGGGVPVCVPVCVSDEETGDLSIRFTAMLFIRQGPDRVKGVEISLSTIPVNGSFPPDQGSLFSVTQIPKERFMIQLRHTSPLYILDIQYLTLKIRPGTFTPPLSPISQSYLTSNLV